MIGRTNAGFGGGSGHSENYWISNVYGGADPPPTGVKAYDIFLRTNVALLRGELTTNVQSTPLWTDSDGAFIISLVGGVLPNTSSSAYFAKNAQHKNFFISGYPGQAYIYENGGWRRCEGYIWNGSAWIQFSSAWDGTLFYNGNQYTNVTGGWVDGGAIGTGYAKGGTMTLNANSIQLSIENYGSRYARTAAKIDLSGFRTLEMDIVLASGDASTAPAQMGVLFGVGIGQWGFSEAAAAKYDIKASGTYTLDVSALSGAYYIAFASASNVGAPVWQLTRCALKG